MGIMKAAAGLDSDPGDIRDAHIDAHTDAPAIKSTIIQDNADASNKDISEITYAYPISGINYLSICLFIIFLYFLCTFLLTRCCHRSHWAFDTAQTMRLYLIKMATFYLTLAICCICGYYHIYRQNNYEENICVSLWIYRWKLLLFIGLSIIIVAVRYMAYGLASSNVSNNDAEYEINWTADNPSYKTILGSFYMYSLSIFSLILLLSIYYIKHHWGIISQTAICMPQFDNRIIDKILLLSVMFLSVNLAIITSELIFRKTNPDDFFGSHLNTPFSTTSAAVTLGVWFPIVFYLYYYIAAYAAQYLIVMMYFIVVDSSFVFLLCLLCAVKRV